MIVRWFFGFLMAYSFSLSAFGDCTLSIEVRDTIGPATYDYLQQAQEKADELKCQSILVRLNTPGGSLQSTRKIVELIMASPRPFLCLIHPSGGHAGSAGAIIMQACHVSGALEATNIGAASPVSGAGQDIPGDLKKKIFEDTKSFVEGLAKYRGRSDKFARDIVTDAIALDAQSAFEAGAIDVVSPNVSAFLEFAKKQEVRLNADTKSPVKVGELELFAPGVRHDLLQIFSNPQWAYLIFMGSLGLLYFEMTHPGTILPGVVGALGIVISLINFHMLDVSWGGVLLIILGVGFMFAEIFVPSFGALGLGGLAAFIVGSLFLFDESTGYQIPLSLLLTTSILLFLLMAGVSYLAIQATRRGLRNRKEESLVGQTIVVKSFDAVKMNGMGFINGELWKFKAREVFVPEEVAIVQKVNGLTLTIVKERGVI